MSSKAPSWQELCRLISNDLGVSIPQNVDPVEYLTNHVLPRHPNSIERSTVVSKYIENLSPSIGYKHLAHLIATGYIRTVLTTNWDPLLEMALSQLMPICDIKVLVRGEVADNIIARYLSSDDSRVLVVKLHGDLASRLLLMRDDEISKIDPELKKAIEALIRRDLIVVGHQLNDLDIIGAMLNSRGDSTIYYVNPKTLDLKSSAGSMIKESGNVVITGIEGYHDEFFRRLNLAVQKSYCDSQEKQKRQIEKEILKKEDQGRGYINYAAISALVTQFSNSLMAAKPDALFFVNDPTAPGGMEIMRRMASLQGQVDFGEILVTGDGKNRVLKRQVRGRTPTLRKNASKKKKKDYRTIFVVDSITFSGNTLRLARDKLRKWYPHAEVKVAALVVSQHYIDALETTGKDVSNEITHTLATDRYEIFFPWGVTQTTGDFDRKFEGIDQVRAVQISKRPWGTIEILASEQMCSVRLLTLEADEKLSFQRHVCRDELFVALDDNIGLDISGENLSEEEFDPYSPAIKSLILEKGDYILIPRGIWHRSKASKERVRLLEVAFGPYDQSGDIQRLADTFGRTANDGGT